MANLDELNLSNEEGEVILYDDDTSEEIQVDLTLCLVGRFLTNKYHSKTTS
jgi:hypothetical protein